MAANSDVIPKTGISRAQRDRRSKAQRMDISNGVGKNSQHGGAIHPSPDKPTEGEYQLILTTQEFFVKRFKLFREIRFIYKTLISSGQNQPSVFLEGGTGENGFFQPTYTGEIAPAEIPLVRQNPSAVSVIRRLPAACETFHKARLRRPPRLDIFPREHRRATLAQGSGSLYLP